MRRWASHKDTAHPPTVAALLAAGAMVLEINAGHWGTPGGKLQPVGAPDLLALYGGRWVAIEVKTPGAKRGPKHKAREEKQAAFRAAARAAGATAYEVHGPLQALAALGCSPVEARRGLAAAERAERKGGMGGGLPPSAAELHLDELAALLAEARKRLGLKEPAYTPPRTVAEECCMAGCTEPRLSPEIGWCSGHFASGLF